MDEKSKRFSLIDVTPTANTGPRIYPIHPYSPQGRASFYAALPSAKYRNIIAYYHQIHSIKNVNERLIYPTGNTGLVFCCDPYKIKAFMVGTPTLPRKAEYANTGRTYFIVFFWPGASYTFFPIQGKELTDKSIPLDDLLPAEFSVLSECIGSADSFEERIKRFEQFMDKRHQLQNNVPNSILIAVTDICRNLDKVLCSEVEGRTHYTDRHFRRLFDKYVGVSPILFKRIMRYQKALLTLSAQPEKSMAELAVDLGYFDQSHLIREFKRFQGCTPTSFLNSRIPLPQKTSPADRKSK